MSVFETTTDRGILVGQNETWTEATAVVTNPYTGRVVGRVGQATAQHAVAAVELAHASLGSSLPAHERADILDRVAQSLHARRDELASLICSEVAKPIAMARAEVDRAATTYQLSSAVARCQTGQTIAMDATPAGVGKVGYTIRRPIGVVTAITPFNFPLNLVAHKLAPALAAGCPVVLKPAPQAPLTAFVLADMCAEAGLPHGFLSVVPGEPSEISSVILEDPRVAAVTFTGSAPVGWHIARVAHRKSVLLELGNASPAIVRADADIARAADLLAPNAFAFAGQTCVSVQRLYVEAGVHDEFVDALIARASDVAYGDPGLEGTACGPVIDDRAAKRTLSTIDAAISKGAQLRLGGERLADGVIPPSVLTHVPQGSDLIQTEMFAPVVSVISVDDLEHGIDLANDSPYGLQASVFTSDLSSALSATTRLDFGSVLVNEAPSFRADNMPYGGVRDSGNTKEGPAWTAASLTAERLCVLTS